jgi:hypothetical protein
MGDAHPHVPVITYMGLLYWIYEQKLTVRWQNELATQVVPERHMASVSR